MVQPTHCARNLCVTQNFCLTMKQHVIKVCQIGHLHLHNIHSIRPYLTTDAIRSLVHAFVLSRLDYANALLFGLTNQLLDQLQRLQNLAARLIAQISRREHITPVLRDLHWLPIRRRIEYKVLVYTFQAYRTATG